VSALAVWAACLRRDFAVARSYRAAIVFHVVAVLGTLAMFFFLGRLVDGRPAAAAATGGYFTFSVVVIMTMQIVQAAMSTFATQLRTDQTTGTLEVLVATPARSSVVAAGGGVYQVLLSVLYGLVTLTLAVVVFGASFNATGPGLLLAILTLAATVALFSGLGVIMAGLTLLIRQTAALSGMLVAGLSLTCGAFYPIDVLPPPLQELASVIPLTWALDILRDCLAGRPADMALLAALVGCALVAVALAGVVFDSALRRAKRLGSLTHY